MDKSSIYEDMQLGKIEDFREHLIEVLPDVGNDQLNEDHMGLLCAFVSFQRTMEEFRQSEANQDGWDKVSFDLDFLSNYAERHFKAEEALMEKANHEFLFQHKTEHNVFRYKVQEYKKIMEAQDLKAMINLKYDLFDWFFDHIKVIDLKYKDQIKAL